MDSAIIDSVLGNFRTNAETEFSQGLDQEIVPPLDSNHRPLAREATALSKREFVLTTLNIEALNPVY